MDAMALEPQDDIAILREGLRLLENVKVPRFSGIDSVERTQQQTTWSERQTGMLRELREHCEDHERVLFAENGGPDTRKFQQHLILIFFEHTGHKHERAEYQEATDDYGCSYEEMELGGLDHRVRRILVTQSNQALRNWFFHHYASTLCLEEWENHPGEVFGFVRYCYFLVQNHMHMEPNLQWFAETFGLRLLRMSQDDTYQSLGFRLLNAVMTYAYVHRDITRNAEEILPPVLQVVSLQDRDYDMALHNVLYHCLRSVRGRNLSLENEAKRMLLTIVAKKEDFRSNHMKTLIRILLLETPEVSMGSQFGQFSIRGQAVRDSELRNYLVAWYRNTAPSLLDVWKLRIGKTIPDLVARFIGCEIKCSGYSDSRDVLGLSVLTWLVIFPTGRTWREKHDRLSILYCILDMLNDKLSNLLLSLRTSERKGNCPVPCVQGRKTIARDALKLYEVIVSGKNELLADNRNWRHGRMKRRSWNRIMATVRRLENKLPTILQLIQTPAIMNMIRS